MIALRDILSIHLSYLPIKINISNIDNSMTSSYQHSYPGLLNITTAGDISDANLFYETWEQGRRNRRYNSLLLVGAMMVLSYLALTSGGASSSTTSTNMRGSPTAMELLSSFHTSSSPEDAPTPDYSGEGRYDWQKCKDSKDPDCWKDEGVRVHSYWRDFWQGFREKMHNLFSGKKQEDEPEEVTEEDAEPAEPEPDAEPDAEPAEEEKSTSKHSKHDKEEEPAEEEEEPIAEPIEVIKKPATASDSSGDDDSSGGRSDDDEAPKDSKRKRDKKKFHKQI